MMCQTLRKMSNSIATHWQPDTAYSAGSVVMRDGIRYYTETDLAATKSFNTSSWTKQSVQEALGSAGGGTKILYNQTTERYYFESDVVSARRSSQDAEDSVPSSGEKKENWLKRVVKWVFSRVKSKQKRKIAA